MQRFQATCILLLWGVLTFCLWEGGVAQHDLHDPAADDNLIDGEEGILATILDEESYLNLDGDVTEQIGPVDANAQSASFGSKKSSNADKRIPGAFGLKENLPWWLDNGKLESICIIILGAVLLQAFQGRQLNRTLAAKVGSDIRPVLQEYFTQVGGPEESSGYIKPYGWDYFEIYATGRKNMQFCIVKLRLAPRQCFWRNLLSAISPSQSNDLIEIEIGLKNTPNNDFSIVLGPKLRQKALSELTEDLVSLLAKRLTSIRRAVDFQAECISVRALPPGIPNRLVALSDSIDAVERLCTPDIISGAITKPRALQMLVVSDQIIVERFPKETAKEKVVLLNGYPASATEFAEFVRTALVVAETASAMKLNDRAKERVRKSREAWEESKAKKTATA